MARPTANPLKIPKLKLRQAVKLVEVSGESFMKGVSYHPNIAIGGLFRSLSNYNPFERLGVFQPSQIGVQAGSGTITVAGLYNVGFASSGLSYFYSFGNTSKVYKVKVVDGHTTDVSAQITNVATIRGAEQFKNYMVYASDSTVFSNLKILALASQTTILAGLQTADHPMRIGPDRNLYIGNKQYVARVTSVTGTAGNSAAYFTFEDDVIVRDLENDGQFLVIAGDTNEFGGSGNIGAYRCFVAFWNMKSQDLTQIWEFEDAQIFSIERVENDIIVHARNNIYTCNVTTPISVLMPLRGNSNFSSASSPGPGNLIKDGNSVLWGSSGNVYGLGRLTPAMSRIFYQPFSVSSGNIVSSFFDGTSVWVMTDTPALYSFTSATRQTSTMILDDVDFKRPFEFAYAKVQLTTALTSGQSVDLQINTANGSKLIQLSNAFTYAADGAKINHIFYPTPGNSAADVAYFEDMTLFTVTNTSGAAIRRIEFWGYPLDPSQDLGY